LHVDLGKNETDSFVDLFIAKKFVFRVADISMGE